jgi:hypothetical protein
MIAITSFMGALLVLGCFSQLLASIGAVLACRPTCDFAFNYKKHADSVGAGIRLESQGNDGIGMQRWLFQGRQHDHFLCKRPLLLNICAQLGRGGLTAGQMLNPARW